MEQDRYESGRQAEERYQALVRAQTAAPASESRDPPASTSEPERTHSAPAPAPAPVAAAEDDRFPGDLPRGERLSDAVGELRGIVAAHEPADLLGDPPAENLTVPLTRNPNARDLAFFGR